MNPPSTPCTLPPAEVARAIKRMRIVDRTFAISAVLLTLAAMWWADGKFGGRTRPVMLVGFGVVGFSVAVLMVFIPFRCPSCRHRLWGSGRYSIGSLDRQRCEKCGVSFEAET